MLLKVKKNLLAVAAGLKKNRNFAARIDIIKLLATWCNKLTII